MTDNGFGKTFGARVAHMLICNACSTFDAYRSASNERFSKITRKSRKLNFCMIAAVILKFEMHYDKEGVLPI